MVSSAFSSSLKQGMRTLIGGGSASGTGASHLGWARSRRHQNSAAPTIQTADMTSGYQKT